MAQRFSHGMCTYTGRPVYSTSSHTTLVYWQHMEAGNSSVDGTSSVCILWGAIEGSLSRSPGLPAASRVGRGPCQARHDDSAHTPMSVYAVMPRQGTVTIAVLRPKALA